MQARRGPALLASLLAVVLVAAGPVAAQDAAVMPVAVEVSPIASFRIGSTETRFGALEFVGGFEMRSPEPVFGQLSAMRFLTPGGEFIGVADHGYWFLGAIDRDGAGVPVGVRDFRMQAMVDRDGKVIEAKSDKDAEGLDVHDGVATVSFEGRARVSEYALEPSGMGRPLRDLDFVVPRNELRFNQGFETLTRAHPYGIHEGARIVVAERSVDGNGDLFAAILDGVEKGVFKVKRTEEFDPTDGVFLPDGDMLLLERRFSLVQGPAVRLRRIYGETVRKGSVADGPVLMEAGLSHRIDNFEALDVWQREDGALVVSLLSDDNQSALQRTLYLEFVLAE